MDTEIRRRLIARERGNGARGPPLRSEEAICRHHAGMLVGLALSRLPKRRMLVNQLYCVRPTASLCSRGSDLSFDFQND